MLSLSTLSRTLAAALCAAALTAPAGAQTFPVAATGWNRDIVIELGATAPFSGFAMAFDTFNGWSWYERGLGTSTKGLPQGGAFTSVVDGTTLGQLQPYNAMNALFLDVTTPSGVLTLAPAAQVAYDALAIFASSSNTGGSGTLVITFTDTTASASIVLNAQDWFNVTTNNALNNLGRGNLNSSTFDDGSAGNPRIYQTTIDMVGLGLNTRNVASIAFTKPAVGGAAQNTVVMGISGRRAVNQLFPLGATGWNRDIVVEAAGAAPFSGFASSFDVANNLSLYEAGLAGSTKGLPAGGSFNSLSNSAIHAQLQPYSAPNALFLNTTLTSATGTLTLNAQVAYEFLAVFASSASGGGAGSMVINFTDGSTSGAIGFNAPDWFNTTTNNALNNLGRANLNTSVIDDASAGNPRVYQSVIDMAALGFNNRAVASITFTKPTAATSTAVLAISGQPASSQPGACCANNGTCSLASLANCVTPNLFQGPGTACSGAGGTCPSAAHACCSTTNGACVYSTGVCGAGFTDRGPGSICSVNSCPPGGSCCSLIGGCTQTAVPASCTGLFTLGATCSPNPCGTPGQCCVGAACFPYTPTGCASVAGAFTAGGSCVPTYPAPTLVATTCTFEDISLGGATPGTAYVAGGNGGTASLDDGTNLGVPIGFSFNFFGSSQSTISICTNGFAYFGAGNFTTFTNVPIPNAATPNNMIAPFWCDLLLTSANQISYATLGTAPNRRFIIQWNNAARYNVGATTGSSTFQAVLYETIDAIVYNYGPLDPGVSTVVPSVGIEDAAGTTGTAYTTPIAPDSTLVFQKVDSTCAGTPVTGACCTGASTCSSSAYGTCLTMCGTYQGNGVACSAAPCGSAAGVCCRGATCNATVTTAAACTGSLIGGQAAGAAFATTGTICNVATISSVPCCYADYNKLGGVSVQDIFDFLGDWFAGSAYANTGGNGAAGTLSVQNIFDFLSNWFNGGC